MILPLKLTNRSESNLSAIRALREQSESNQRAIREHSESTQRQIRALKSELYSRSPKYLMYLFIFVCHYHSDTDENSHRVTGKKESN